MYEMIIDPNKWIKISDTKLEADTPYWAKMTDGRIVMFSPFSNNGTSGCAKCSVSNNGIAVLPNIFYLLKNCMVQPVIYK